MVFSSTIFVFYFLPVVLLLYYNLPYRWRNPFLTLVSYGFYGWWKPWFILLMLAVTFVNYQAGRWLVRPGASPVNRRATLALSCAVSLGLLGFFKYYMFSAESLNVLLSWVGLPVFRILEVVLPIGISFFTFQALSYTVDVYRGDAPPARSFGDFACFVALFPQLIAGPIIRYHTVAQQLQTRQHTVERFAAGILIFSLGFAKKVLLANPMGEVADAVFSAESAGLADAWFGVTAYAFQIYFDFCGYSDMAVGLGRMFGFEFMKNFDAPYRAESITEVWRRWHLSLSTFLRDYLYIPLGGNRRGPWRTYYNLGLVMVLGGLWHGAKWTFVLWGVYHGCWLAWERWRGKRSLWANAPRPLRIGFTFVLMLFAWVLFRSESLESAVSYYGGMFGFTGVGGARGLLSAELYTPSHLWVLGLCVVLVFQRRQAHDWAAGELTWGRVVVAVLLLMMALVTMFNQSFNPFLYFQF
ncbi:MAG: MBOAT family protein [Verrucomicrobia bacterium]|nr:MBOAT family protein [Verrucomicrobiota bacterium]